MSVAPSQLGIDSLKRFIIQLFAISENLDRDKNGKISGAEWGAAAFELVLSFVANNDLTNEVRDLTLDEITELVKTAGENFPNYAGIDDKVENVVRVALSFLANTVSGARELFAALHALNEKPVVATEPSPDPNSASNKKWTKGDATTEG